MTVNNSFQERYKTGNAPWDIGRPDSNLTRTVAAMNIKPCKALDIGCGTGDNSIWLAQNGFEVTGIDNSELAIQKAKEKAAETRVNCSFLVTDFLTGKIENTPFSFAFDRGCFHLQRSAEERRLFAQRVAELLANDGLWLSISGNADEKREGPGPPQLSARDIVNAVEPYFEILSLVTSHFDSNRPNPPRAWVCLMRKRQPKLK